MGIFSAASDRIFSSDRVSEYGAAALLDTNHDGGWDGKIKVNNFVEIRDLQDIYAGNTSDGNESSDSSESKKPFAELPPINKLYIPDLSKEDFASLVNAVRAVKGMDLPRGIDGYEGETELLIVNRQQIFVECMKAFHGVVSDKARQAVIASAVEEYFLNENVKGRWEKQDVLSSSLLLANSNEYSIRQNKLHDGSFILTAFVADPSMNSTLSRRVRETVLKSLARNLIVYLDTLWYMLDGGRGVLEGVEDMDKDVESVFIAAYLVARGNIAGLGRLSTDELNQLVTESLDRLRGFVRNMKPVLESSHRANYGFRGDTLRFRDVSIHFMTALLGNRTPPLAYPIPYPREYRGFRCPIHFLRMIACADKKIIDEQTHEPCEEVYDGKARLVSPDKVSRPDDLGVTRVEPRVSISWLPEAVYAATVRRGGVFQIPVIFGRNEHGLYVALTPASSGDAKDLAVCLNLKTLNPLATVPGDVADLVNPSSEGFGEAFQEVFKRFLYMGTVNIGAYVEELRGTEMEETPFHVFMVLF